MSAELYSACGPHGNNANLHSTAVGGSKPLHRFIRGQPKIIGIVLLVLGSSFFILSISMAEGSFHNVWRSFAPGFWLGALFITCGILYILTEHNPTKKTVTISLALSIVALLGAFWAAFMSILPSMAHSSYLRSYEIIHHDDNGTEIVVVDWSAHYEAMIFTLEAIFEFYIFVGAVIFIVMSSLAGAALRSTKTQALVVMTATPPTE
ncbi:uncharacterized protein [Centroberyx affinis]|uniref:uncharacterized protein n=1 Tax=Centroberyx affinis TaxID=166261 RepID=UPI003A5C4372